MKKVLIVFGTRPEAIKMAPLIRKLRNEQSLKVSICVTGQHAELLTPVLEFFGIVPDFNLNIMEHKPALPTVYSLILAKMETVIQQSAPDLILVHGDTATTAAVSMSAFLNKIEIGHVEAGLRTGDIMTPWPEEFNRKLVSLIAKYHFAPTAVAMNNLLAEGIKRHQILVTGNTVIDALFETLALLNNDEMFLSRFYQKYPFMQNDKKTVLVTMHRRENFGSGVEDFCDALKSIARRHPGVQVVFPVHLNPNIKKPVTEAVGNERGIFLIDPMDYCDFVFMMKKSYLIITDSGGVQEEAPSLGKPVLVTRTSTERPEAVVAQTVRLVGTDKNLILQWVDRLVVDSSEYSAMTQVTNPYGDGRASERIVQSILDTDTSTSVNWVEKAYEYVREQRMRPVPMEPASATQVMVN